MNGRNVTPLHTRLLAGCTGLALLAAVSCAERKDVYLESGETPRGFVPADAGASGDADVSLPESVAMCPVTTCSHPWATCPSSKFPCSTDLLNDDHNCGGCGIACTAPYGQASDWACVNGRCALACQGVRQDCDGDPSTGCEVDTYADSNNCGDCGAKCPAGSVCKQGQCKRVGCPEFADQCNGLCTNLQVDDMNCGACGDACDPSGPNKPALGAGMHYGCRDGSCGAPKCDYKKLDCNGDKEDGCEANRGTNEHCNSCDDACGPGKECMQAGDDFFLCMCPNDKQTICSNSGCVILDEDPLNCGGCNNVCPGLGRPHFDVTCTLGVCGGKCADGHADCDGVPDNGCEVDTRIDNRNCGACGSACLPDQPCFEGKCVVAPCAEPGGETK